MLLGDNESNFVVHQMIRTQFQYLYHEIDTFCILSIGLALF